MVSQDTIKPIITHYHGLVHQIRDLLAKNESEDSSGKATDKAYGRFFKKVFINFTIFRLVQVTVFSISGKASLPRLPFLCPYYQFLAWLPE